MRVVVSRRWVTGPLRGRGPQWPIVVVIWIALIRGGRPAVYLNKWAVEIMGGTEAADRVAAEYGFRNLGQIGSLENYYLFEQRRLVKRSASPSRHHRFLLRRAPEVVWAEQQSVKRRYKREYKVELDRWKPKLNDPAWPEMWYLNHHGARGGHDMNVIGAWRLGYTGKGVVVTILDDGIEHSHSDLRQNYDPEASFDINDNDIDPMPRYDKADENKHGTRCAGEVAAAANNSLCGVGVAFNARIGGVRMLDGDVVDAVEAQALSLNPQHIDIYSASWGPEDNGKLVDGPATLAKEAFLQGVLRGRGGKGSIYVWASGNGGSVSDSCSCDGYANSIYTLSVSSTSEFGTKPWYLEECSSTIATTYSSGEYYKERKIITTDLHDRCIDNHTGTSASAPLAAGMCALALEANPDLTWRDMQHIVLMTARSEPLRDAQWVVNGVGRQVSHRYGYGLMDGQAMVLLAEKWTTMPEQRVCTTDVITVDKEIEGSGISVTFDTTGCKDTPNEVNFLEHVQARVLLTYSCRGDLQIHLVSPNGTRSTLLPRRKQDYQLGEFQNWSFMSVFYWGEQPHGTWTLVLENVGSLTNSGNFENWQLVMYGTKEDPVNLKDTTSQNSTVSVTARDNSTAGYDLESFVTLASPNTSESSFFPSTKSRPGLTNKYKSSISKMTTNQTARRGKTTTSAPHHALSTTAVATLATDATNKSVLAPEVVVVVTPSSVPNGTETSDLIGLSSSIGSYDVKEVTLNKTVEVDSISDKVTASASHIGTTVEEMTSTQFLCDSECTADGCFGPGPENCFVCRHARYENRCVSPCPNFTFYDPGSASCRLCRFPCAECTPSAEGDDHNCVVCDSDGDTAVCVDWCPLMFYADFDQRRCLACIPNCLVCVNDAANCQLCADGFDLENSICTEACDISEYRDEDGRCQLCDINCETCIGPSAMDCQTCAPNMLHESDLCVTNCSEGYYHDGDRTCEMCHPSCSACFGPEDNECFGCFHPFKLFELSCVESCPIGHFEDNDELCHNCHESCSACIGPRENDCVDCPPTRFYFDGRCADNCTEGLYPVEVFNHVTEGMTNHCEVCHGTCRTCSGGAPVDCIHCFKGLVLSSGRCIGSCEPHKYKEDDQCVACDESCAVCYGPSVDHCLECPSDHSLLGGQCLTDCPHGYYTMDGQCLFCSIECYDCTDYGADSCVACASGYVMQDGVCVVPLMALLVNCSGRRFYNAADRNCGLCHDSCQTCSGPTEYQCLSCSPPKMLHLESGRCLPCCTDFDVSQDVAVCCSCDLILGICIDVWDNPRPESPAQTSDATMSDPRNVTPSVILSSTLQVYPSSHSRIFIPSSKSVTTNKFSPSTRRFPPLRNKTKTTTSSLLDEETAPGDAGITSVPPVEDTERRKTQDLLKVTASSSQTTTFGGGVMDTELGAGFRLPWVMALLLALCCASFCVIVLVIVFCIVRAKASGKLCWSKRRYRPVPVVCHAVRPLNLDKAAGEACQV